MKRAVDMIINWNKEKYNSNITHLHWDNDNTIPLKNVKPTITIEGGSYMMALTVSEKIGMIVQRLLLH